MKNISDFRASRVKMTRQAYATIYGNDEELTYSSLFVYADGLAIWTADANQYYLIVERSDYLSADLGRLEEILWDDFGKWEFDISIDDLEEDLHERARDLVAELGLTCSLDEVDRDNVSSEYLNQIEYILRQFDSLGDRRTPMAELIPEPTKTHYLYGTDAIHELDENGIEGVIAEYEGNEIDYGTFCFIEGETRSVDFIQSFQNWSEYVIITEEEFNALNQ
jgi:hypothetical protein